MKKVGKVFLITIFLTLLPVANLFALSKEATEAIESIRTKLNQQSEKETETSFKTSNSNQYIPGKELSAALAKIKHERYLSEKKFNKIEINAKKTAPSKANDKFTDNLENSIAVESKEDITLTAVSPKPVESKINSNETIAKQELEPTKPNNQKCLIGSLLEESIMRIRKSRRTPKPARELLDEAIEKYEEKLINKDNQNSLETMEKADKEINELFNNPEKLSEVAEKKRNKQLEQETIEDSEDNNNVIDDETFNYYISKYNFQMPENYRIIIE